MSKNLLTAFAATAALSAGSAAVAQDDPAQILFNNCAVFDGMATELTEGQNVLVTGNLIEAIGDAPLSAEGATTVDCDGRTLMPGLIEGHAGKRRRHIDVIPHGVLDRVTHRYGLIRQAR